MDTTNDRLAVIERRLAELEAQRNKLIAFAKTTRTGRIMLAVMGLS